MYSLKRCFCLLCLAVFAFSGVLFAQDTPSADFGFDLGIGAESFEEPGSDEPVTYQLLSLNPDFAFGKFGIGLDLSFHYRFTGGDGGEFEFRTADWVPSEAGVSFLELYLPRFRYIRWGFRGDPLFIKLGSIDDATLGNGFIMGNYDNTLFLPEIRIFGMNFDIDGQLFDFPYVGLQSFIGNLAKPDIIGGRLFVRPLVWLSMPILPQLEIGYTLVGDIDPFRYVEDPGDYGYSDGNDESILVHGADFRLPLISNDIISLATFGDLVFQGSHTGGMLGAGARFFKILPLGLQLRFLGKNFIPVYYGPTYDVYRGVYYAIAGTEEEIVPAYAGWYASTGFAFFEDQLMFSAAIDGPFGKPVDEDALAEELAQEGLTDEEIQDEIDEKTWVNYPHIRATFVVGQELLQGFDFNFWYDKKNIRAFADLIDPSNAVVGAAVNYYTGPAVLTLEWDIVYKPEDGTWDTTAKLKSSISLF
jgi:hypothetical protein